MREKLTDPFVGFLLNTILIHKKQIIELRRITLEPFGKIEEQSLRLQLDRGRINGAAEPIVLQQNINNFAAKALKGKYV